MKSFVQPLFDGPVDIVGDVHGEWDALKHLLQRLGYDAEGRHPQGRRLVFAGDLVDRGPDSPAVLNWVARACHHGRAQAILGNHELNALLHLKKPGNGWWFHYHPDDPDNHDRCHDHFVHSKPLCLSKRLSAIAFLESLPLALVRPGLTVVHAAPWPNMHALGTTAKNVHHALPALSAPVDSSSWNDIYWAWSKHVRKSMEDSGLWGQRLQEKEAWEDRLYDASASIPWLSALAESDEQLQSLHPMRRLVSGTEAQRSSPAFTHGKWRFTERQSWWTSYEEHQPIVMGHYWRCAGPHPMLMDESLFSSAHPSEWLGPRRNVMCVDWGAGLLSWDRHHRHSSAARLGALRLSGDWSPENPMTWSVW